MATADHDQEDQQRVGQQRLAVDVEQAAVGQLEQRRAAEAERAALDDGLRHAANQEHAAERHDERLQLQPRDEQPLQQADEQRDAERDGDADPERVAEAARARRRELGDDHAGQADDRADRQVDPAGDDHERHADREDARASRSAATC